VSATPCYSLEGKRVFVAGHRGMVGSALLRRLERENADILTVTRSELDLRHESDVARWLKKAKPHVIFLAAARVGGIHANNTRPAEFLYDNIAIQNSVIHGAYESQTEKLLFVASSCIFPREAPQPLREDYLLTGPLEPTNEAYAIAKIAGVKMCNYYRRQYDCDFISATPCNLYGPHDNFDPLFSHVIPGMMLRAHNAKLGVAPDFQVWGTGAPRREFLHVDDAADALVFLLKNYSGDFAHNVGSGNDVTIGDLVSLIAAAVGYNGPVSFDTAKPDGMLVKRLDVSRMQSLGWKARIDLASGLRSTYQWFLANKPS
jgi:GDP-L-fucose synthase